MNSENYIKKWLEGSLSEAELREFSKTEDYKALKKLDEAVQQFKAPAWDVEHELARLNKARSSSHAMGKTVFASWIRPVLKIAASVAVIFLTYLFISYDNTTTIATGIAEKTTVTLPDNSLVTLNAQSSLSYTGKNWQQNRQVKLDGEAFFEVARGSKFDVLTDNGTVSVLGTRFTVTDREKYFEVVCFEGLVAVQAEQEQVKLPPGHMFRVIDGEVIKETDIKESAPGWLADESSFRSVPYKYVIEELERQYGVVVSIRRVNLDQLFTGRFTHKNLSLALKSISLPLNLQYKIVGENQIELSGDKE